MFRSIIILDGINWNKFGPMTEWWSSFNPEGYIKITDIGLHPLEDAGIGILIKKED